PIPLGYQVRLHRRRAKTSPRDNRQPRTFFGSVPRSKRRRPPILRKQTIGPAFHREEPKTLGADRRLSWSLGVDFPVATLNATSESLRRCWDLRVAKSKPIRYCVATDAAHFSSTATRSSSSAIRDRPSGRRRSLAHQPAAVDTASAAKQRGSLLKMLDHRP